jgi:hypothetical protein
MGFFKLELKLPPSSLLVLKVYFRVEVGVHLLFYVFVILLFICINV